MGSFLLQTCVCYEGHGGATKSQHLCKLSDSRYMLSLDGQVSLIILAAPQGGKT